MGLSDMWSLQITIGCLGMIVAWCTAFGLIGVGFAVGSGSLGQLGLATSAMAATLSIIRDNTRTRRMLEAQERRRGGGGGGQGENVVQIR